QGHDECRELDDGELDGPDPAQVLIIPAEELAQDSEVTTAEDQQEGQDAECRGDIAQELTHGAALRVRPARRGMPYLVMSGSDALVPVFCSITCDTLRLFDL